MNKKLLSFVRHLGDINLSVNGEAKVGFSIDGNWVNNFTATLTGDQGCVFKNDPSAEVDASAIGALVKILSNISLVPYQNDSTYEKYVTPEAGEWLKSIVGPLILSEFREKPDVYKVECSYIPEGETEPTIVVHAELRTNQYANSIFESIKDIDILGDVISTSVSDEGEVTYVYKTTEDLENTITRNMDDKIHMVGIDGFTKATKLYECNDGYLLIASEKFVPFIEESKISKI